MYGSPFRKVLIANRGEIAVRIIRACRDEGFQPVAVFSDADRRALHVRMADEAVPIGPSPPTESYLNIERILYAARKVGAEAIHPGYGFLAENPEFAEACRNAGLVWVGPSPSAMRKMGSKTTARRMLEEMGLPVVPGTAIPLESLEQAQQIASRIGYPVMLKASAGGGGKGMRMVATPDELPRAFENARSEAFSAFGDDAVYLEKVVQNPRHIEIQLIGDQHGHAIYLGERECSIQRRHQKLLEETPSPVLDESTRRRMGDTAVAAAKQAGYDNAGTVEFLVDGDNSFFFLEMNTRLQVEHPVTEMVTGLDLVRLQFQVAAGEPLTLRQQDIQPRGTAIECRIYAEDPLQKFFPCPGVVKQLVEPAGTGVRVDSGVYQGFEVPIFYDALVAKLITWGQSRQEALERMRRALQEYRLGGIQSTLPLFRAILQDPQFLSGDYDTNYLNGRLEKLMENSSRSTLEKEALATVLAYHLASRDSRPASRPEVTYNPWREAARRDGLRKR